VRQLAKPATYASTRLTSTLNGAHRAGGFIVAVEHTESDSSTLRAATRYDLNDISSKTSPATT
jgi:hypothetical protein